MTIESIKLTPLYARCYVLAIVCSVRVIGGYIHMNIVYIYICIDCHWVASCWTDLSSSNRVPVASQTNGHWPLCVLLLLYEGIHICIFYIYTYYIYVHMY